MVSIAYPPIYDIKVSSGPARMHSGCKAVGGRASVPLSVPLPNGTQAIESAPPARPQVQAKLNRPRGRDWYTGQVWTHPRDVPCASCSWCGHLNS